MKSDERRVMVCGPPAPTHVPAQGMQQMGHLHGNGIPLIMPEDEKTLPMLESSYAHVEMEYMPTSAQVEATRRRQSHSCRPTSQRAAGAVEACISRRHVLGGCSAVRLTQARTSARTLSAHTHMHAHTHCKHLHTHTQAHTRTHTHTHTHTHTCPHYRP